MRLLLSEPLPLRTTRALGDFAEDTVLPHRYGDLTAARFALIRLSDKRFFVADHPMTVTAVYVDDQETKGWEAQTASDGEGHTWTEVVLTAPAPNEARLSAAGTGKRNPTTGALLENPAEIIEDVLRLAGRTEQWGGLRAECAAASLRLAGSLDEPLSIRAQIDRIAESAVAIWSGQVGRLYPVETVSGLVRRLEKWQVSGLTVSASLTDTADILRLGYDESTATGRMQHSIELTASPATLGGVAVDVDLPMLRTPANAEAAGRRYLARLAGERYEVAFDTDATDLRPGAWVELVANPEWPIPGADPIVMVLAVEIADDVRIAAVTGETILSYPTITVTAHSLALPTTRDASVSIAVKAGIATLRIADENDQPIFNARVAIDNGPAKKTDEKGMVSFAVKPGPHKLAIQAPGKMAQVLTVEL